MNFNPLRSLNARLLLAILASMLLALAIGGAVIHELFKQRLLDNFDRSLGDDLSFHIIICDQDDENGRAYTRIEYANMQHLRREHKQENPVFAQYRFASNNRRYYKSPNLKGNDLPAIGAGSAVPIFDNTLLFNGKPARAVGLEFDPANHGELPTDRMHLVVAKELTSVFDSLKLLRQRMYEVSVALTILLLASTTVILRKNLKPLKELSRQIGATPITASGTKRFSLKGAPAELDPVVGRLNTLIERVEGAFERERQFTANAAHELRNPLAGIRSQIELSLGAERSPEKYRETLESIYDIEQGMERVVENLLMLARLESGEEVAQQDIVPITEVLRRGWRKVFDTAEQKNLHVVMEIQNPMPALKTARNLVSIIVRNLLDNAVDYSPHGGEVKISAHYDRLINSATIRVANENTSLTEDDCKQMFELFWRRQDDDTNHDHRHSGLGLGLCRRIVHVLNGELKVRLTEGQQNVEFICTFPCETLSV